MFPLVYVWVRQWGAWKLHSYKSIAQIHIPPFIKTCPFGPVWNINTNFAVMMAMLVVVNTTNPQQITLV